MLYYHNKMQAVKVVKEGMHMSMDGIIRVPKGTLPGQCNLVNRLIWSF